MEKRLQKRLNDLEYTPSGSLWDRIDQDLKTDFEKKLENKFDAYSVRNNPDNWDKIESSLPSEKSGWNHFQTFAYVIVGVAILGLIYLFMPKQPFQQTAEQNIPATVTMTEENIVPAQDIVKPETPALVQQAPVTKRNVAQRSSSVQVMRKNTVKSASPTVAKTSNTTSVSALQKNETTTPSEPALVTPTAIETTIASSTRTVTQDQTALTSSGTETEVTNPSATLADQNPASPTETPNHTPPTASKEALAKNEIPATQEIKLMVPELASIALAPPSDSVHKIQPIDPNAISTVGLNDPDKLTDFSIRVIAGAYVCFNRLETPAASSRSFDKNKALRNNLEIPDIDWSGLFLLDYRINDRWSFSTGMGILNFNQSFYFNTEVPVSTTGSTEKGAQIIYPNDSIVMGTNYSTRIKYSWTEIPVLIRYKLTQQPRLNIELEAGLSYAIISTIDAGMVSYDNVGVLIIKDKEAFPGIQNNWFATFAPSVTYKLNNEVTLGLMPTAKFALNSMVTNKDWMQQYPYFFGLNATLTKRF